VLVVFAPDARWISDDLLEMKEELQDLLGRPVDLVEKHLVEASTNYLPRGHIPSHMETLFVA